MADPQSSGFGLGRTEVKRRHLLPKALAVGVCSGVIASAFRIALRAAESWRVALETIKPGYVALFAVLFAGGLSAGLAVWLVSRFAPEAGGSGIPHLKAVVLGEVPLRWRRVLSVKFASGLIGIGGGLALGREGPTIQMGGAAGKMVSDWFQIVGGEGERRALISAGAGAGLAAAFNAPLAGMIFVLEELHGAFNPIIFVAAFLASVTADVVARLLAGAAPVFAVHGIPAPPLSVLPAAALTGIGAGVLGVAFNRSILKGLDFCEHLRWPPFLLGAAVGALAGLAGWFVPGLAGTGSAVVVQAMAGGFALGAIPLLLAARFGLTVASFGTGTAGGIFLPLLVIGALGGLSMGHLAHAVTPTWIPHPEVFAVLGMGALFTATVRAPLTGLVLMIELTGVYDFMLPLLVSCFAAYGIADALGEPPIYEALRERRYGKAALP